MPGLSAGLNSLWGIAVSEENKGPETALGFVVIDDGYTLVGTVQAEGRPRLVFRYRPALPEDTIGHNMKFQNATTGAERMAALAELLDAHVEGWEGVTRRLAGGQMQAVPWKKGILDDKAIRRAIGADYLMAMANYVNQYTMGQLWESDAKNS